MDDFNLGNWYNPETHDLVEKKDAKITRLKKEVEELQRLLDFESKVIDERISSLADRKLELDKLKDELKDKGFKFDEDVVSLDLLVKAISEQVKQ